MLVNRERKFGFIHIPKTGGVSIIRNILEPLGVERTGSKPNHHPYRPELFEPDWFVFAFVRNPYTRAVSMYRHQAMKNKRGMTENGFADWLVRMQFEMIDSGIPVTQAEEVGPQVTLYRYEQFDEGVEQVCQRLGVGRPRMQLNTAMHYYGEYDWRALVTGSDIELINQVYRRDFEAFGYKME